MDYTGTIRDMFRGMDGKFTISLNIEEEPGDIEKLKDKRLRIKITEYKQKRSLDANALLWHCLGKMGKAFIPPRDKWEMYLEELRKYGKYSYVLMDQKAVDSFKQMWRETEIVGEVDVNGRKAVQLLCYYGSSTYNTKEFSVLLDGVIEDMKDLGVQPPIPEDIKSALEEWEKQHGKQND